MEVDEPAQEGETQGAQEGDLDDVQAPVTLAPLPLGLGGVEDEAFAGAWRGGGRGRRGRGQGGGLLQRC